MSEVERAPGHRDDGGDHPTRRLPFHLVLVAVALVATTAFADTFDYTVDRFEVDGNVNGPLDGVPDLVDDFNDGVLAPWFLRRGTASESGGLLHVQTPGLAISLPGVFPVAFEASAAGVDNVVHAGNGDAVLRVVLPQQAIGANDAVSFDFSTTEGLALYYAGIVLTNFNSSLANSFTPPYPTGLAATAHLERLSFTNQALVSQHHAIAPASVTGPFVLELRYDDTARQITPAVSVDGGATFEAVFDPVDVETDSGAITVQTAAAAYAGACPADSGLRTARFGGLANPPGRQKMKLMLTFPSPIFYYSRGDFRLVITDEGAGGATLYDVTVPDGATAFQHPCGPLDGYGAKGYSNFSNALPPACVPGSANGLRSVRMRWYGALDLRIQAIGASIPHITGPVKVSVYDGTGPVNDCDGWARVVPCRASSKGAQCKQ